MCNALSSNFLQNLSRYLLCFLLGSLVLSAAPRAAESVPASWDITQLMQSLSRVKAARPFHRAEVHEYSERTVGDKRC